VGCASQELAGHDNIIRLLNIVRAENDRDLYLVFEFMETDLHAVIRANILEDIHKQYVIYQLLRSLLFMHSAGLLHRDIKPSNLLLNSDCHARLCDFGLCRSIAGIEKSSSAMLTDYVATRWYRAPEILLGSTKYGVGVDMWAVGCILGEMINGKPVFPGSSTMNQLDRILEVTGQPSADDIASIRSPYAATMLDGLPAVRPRRLSDVFPKADDVALDFIGRCLIFNPNRRMTVEEALKHKYVDQFHSPADEPRCPRVIKIQIDDNVKYTASDYRDRLYREIAKKKKEARARKAQRGSATASASASAAGAPTPGPPPSSSTVAAASGARR
jgi:mitogen-activated protein kinase 15